MTATERVLIVGGGSGIAQALVAHLVADGVDVVVGARHPEQHARDGVRTARVDLTDETTIAALRDLGPFDHVISLAAAPTNGPVAQLDRDAIHTAFDAKVIGPMLLAKHLAPAMRPRGSFILFSGFAAWAPSPDRAVMATTNGAVSFLAAALAVDLAPVRAVAISPGVIDSGAWDRLGADSKKAVLDTAARTNPVRRAGTPADIVRAVRMVMANEFVTGTTIHVDGGARWV